MRLGLSPLLGGKQRYCCRCFVSGVVSALNEWTAQRVTEWTALIEREKQELRIAVIEL